MLEELCKRIQHCCATLRRSRNKRNVGSCWLKSLTDFKLCSTTRNNIQQHATCVQTDATCKIQQCCVRLYSALLQRTVSFKCLPIHVHLYALLVKRQKANSQTNISRPVIGIKAKHTSKRSLRVVLFGLLLIENSNFYPLILTLSVLKVANVKNSQKFEISFVENP